MTTVILIESYLLSTLLPKVKMHEFIYRVPSIIDRKMEKVVSLEYMTVSVMFLLF